MFISGVKKNIYIICFSITYLEKVNCIIIFIEQILLLRTGVLTSCLCTLDNVARPHLGDVVSVGLVLQGVHHLHSTPQDLVIRACCQPSQQVNPQLCIYLCPPNHPIQYNIHPRVSNCPSLSLSFRFPTKVLVSPTIISCFAGFSISVPTLLQGILGLPHHCQTLSHFQSQANLLQGILGLPHSFPAHFLLFVLALPFSISCM